MRRDPLRAFGGRAALRRRQPQTAVGEGQTGEVPHPALRPAGLSKSAQGNDRGQSREEDDGKEKICL